MPQIWAKLVPKSCVKMLAKFIPSTALRTKQVKQAFFMLLTTFESYNPVVSALDARIAQFWPENRIPHAKICIVIAGNV